MSAAGSQKTQVRAACYCRISADPKDKREGVDRQRADTAEICTINQWKPVGYYIDNDRSASNGQERENWDRLLGDVEAGKVDAIVVWNQDRGWRKMADLESLRPLLEPRGVLLATTNIGVIDFRNADDVFRAQVSTALSEMEIAKMKVRMLRAARQKAEQGIPKWKRAFGYLGDTHQPDPAVAPLVRQAYAAVLAGSSLNDICRLWNDAGALTLNGNRWSAPQVSNYLRKPRNAGLRAHNGEIVGKGTWPGLVDEDTWKAAQNVLNARGRAPGRKSVSKHLLTGVMGCGKCGHYLSGNWVMQKTGGKPGRPKADQTKEPHPGEVAHSITYTCKNCRGNSIRAGHAEPLLYNLVGGRLAKPDAVDLLKTEVHDEAEAEALRAEKAVLYGRLDEVADERADGLLTGAQARRATERITAKLGVIERREQDAERLRVFDGIPLGTAKAVDAVKGLTPDRFRSVLDVLVTITVEPVGKVGRVFIPERVKVQWR